MDSADGTGGKSISDIMAASTIPYRDTGSGSSVSMSSGSRGPVNPDNLMDISALMHKSISANKQSVAAAQAADAIQTDTGMQSSQNGANLSVDTANSASALAGQQSVGSLEVQTKNQTVLNNITNLNPNDMNSNLVKSTEDFNLAMDRRIELNKAADWAHQHSTVSGLLFGDTTVSEFMDANFVNTESNYQNKAAYQEDLADMSAKRLGELTQIYTGAADRNKTTANMLTTASAADAATVAATPYIQNAIALQQQATMLGTARLQRVMSSAQQDSGNMATVAHIDVLIQNALRMEGKDALRMEDKNPADLVAAINAGGRLLGSPTLANIKSADLKLFMSDAKNKDLLTEAYKAGVGMSIYAKTDPDGLSDMPNLLGSPGRAVHTLEASRGTLPDGMGRVQKLLTGLSANTEYAVENGVKTKLLKPDERMAYIDMKLPRWYDANAANIDGTAEYGMPSIKAITVMGSMNSDPDVALLNKTILAPLAAASDTVPAKQIIDMALAKGLPYNTVLKGMTAYVSSVQANLDATAKYGMVGLKSSKSVPYTAELTKSFGLTGRITHAVIGDNPQFRSYLSNEFAARARANSLENVNPAVAIGSR